MMLHAAIPLWILVAIALWFVSRPWRERRRHARNVRRMHELLHPQSLPAPPPPKPSPAATQPAASAYSDYCAPHRDNRICLFRSSMLLLGVIMVGSLLARAFGH
jgi:hypothetical protein